jgi:ATP-dependent Clp protease ATP-binding subunit ClpX
VQIDTSNILFVGGGAFDGLEQMIERRMNRQTLGFRANVESRSERDPDMLAHVLPDDLMKFGLIPEFIGRLPVVATLTPLDEDALVQILAEPKNAMTKEYRRMMQFDDVDLEFTPGALRAVAREAITRGTGARALRTILEEVMRDVMYEVPSMRNVDKVLITEETIRDGKEPELILRQDRAA